MPETVRIAAGPLRVGIATADITPAGPVGMAGFGFRKFPSEGVGKPITASCVVFDNGVTRLALVALDLCYIGKTQLDDLRAAAQKAKIPPQHLMVNFSHTHSGPNVGDKNNAAYAARFKSLTDALFAKAVADLQPALLDYTGGLFDYGHQPPAVGRQRPLCRDAARAAEGDRSRRAHPADFVARGQGAGHSLRICVSSVDLE